MSISPRFAPLVYGGLLSAIMVAVVSGFVLFINQGAAPDFVARWLKSIATTWPVAFPTVLVVAPLVRRFVARLTAR